jgi:outer membrane protein assembly factor BamE
MRILLIALLCSLTLSGCQYFRIYQHDIQQGNVITPQMVSSLHLGMSQNAAKRIMGEPILEDMFANNRAVYVYTFKPGKQKMREKRLILTFRNGKLVNIEKDLGRK